VLGAALAAAAVPPTAPEVEVALLKAVENPLPEAVPTGKGTAPDAPDATMDVGKLVGAGITEPVPVAPGTPLAPAPADALLLALVW